MGAAEVLCKLLQALTLFLEGGNRGFKQTIQLGDDDTGQ